MAANRRKQDDKNLEILRELISINGNKYCLDCNQRGPTYVNSTIGSFVCSKCSGMLRGLTPPHRVKSISMATFTPEEIEFIKVRGNDYCRRVWLGLYEGESVNFIDEQSVKDFMSDKYEKKRYYLESPLNNPPVTNGSLTSRSKSKTKAGNTVASTAPLISMAAPVSKATVNNNTLVNTPKFGSSLLSSGSDNVSMKIARPVHGSPPALAPMAPPAAPVPVPDFPVDFSTANIYNSSQFNNNVNNNFVPQSTTSTPAFAAFTPPSSTANDRYAALADLDHALRQQNMKTMEEGSNISSKNPFQSASTHDLVANKNPFFNGSWSVAAAAVPVNPFMPAPNPGNYVNSNNPFL
ncbi:arf GTPase activating protein drongo [Choristoneura fumiferana]|uniref:arf GTPase activating protein drongo n=1 Tax=Choristoneura fumiferana TaxID=7141 RepID=UPI003D15A1EC